MKAKIKLITKKPTQFTTQTSLVNVTYIYINTFLYNTHVKCVRLSRLLAFECTLNHCTFISFHFITNSPHIMC